MAQLSNIKRIIKEQLPADVQKWIDGLLIPLNNAISQFTYALTSQLTISDNFLGAVKTFTLKSSDLPFTFSHGLNVKPKILLLGQITDTQANATPFVIGPVPIWSIGSTGNTIIIETITGLDSTRTYSVTFVVLAN